MIVLFWVSDFYAKRGLPHTSLCFGPKRDLLLFYSTWDFNAKRDPPIQGGVRVGGRRRPRTLPSVCVCVKFIYIFYIFSCQNERCATKQCANERCVTERCATERCDSERCVTERCANEQWASKRRASER